MKTEYIINIFIILTNRFKMKHGRKDIPP